MTRKLTTSNGFEVLVDDEDYERLSQYNWYATGDKHTHYAIRREYANGKQKNIRMHRELMNPPEGKVVDHINGNGLDNRKENLRVCLQSQNCRNARKYEASNRYIGVTYLKTKDKWQANGNMDGKQVYLGIFDCEIAAARARDAYVRQHYGEFAKFNFPQEHLTDDTNQLKLRIQELEKRLDEADRELENLQDERDKFARQLSQHEVREERLRAKLAEVTALLEAERTETLRTHEKYNEARAKLAEAEADITDLKKNYAGMRDTQRMLVIERDEAQAKLADMEDSVLAAMTTASNAQTKLAEAEATGDRLLREKNQIQADYESMRTSYLTSGDELIALREVERAARHYRALTARESFRRTGESKERRDALDKALAALDALKETPCES